MSRNDKKYVITGTYDITIHYVTEDDLGRYQCLLESNIYSAYLSGDYEIILAQNKTLGW